MGAHVIEPMELTEFFTCYRYPNPTSGFPGPKSVKASSGAPRPRHDVPSCGRLHVGEEAANSHQDQLEKVECDRACAIARSRGEDPDSILADGSPIAPLESLWFVGRWDRLREYSEEFNARINATISPEAKAVMMEIGRQMLAAETSRRAALGGAELN